MQFFSQLNTTLFITISYNYEFFINTLYTVNFSYLAFPKLVAMRDILKQKASFLFFVLLLSLTLCNAASYALPSRGRVLDKAGILSPSEVAQIESELAEYDTRTSVEIVLITTRDLEGLDLNEYATQLGNSMALGKKDLNNGVIILIVPSKMPPFSLPNTAAHEDTDPLSALLNKLDSDATSDTASTLPSLLEGIYVQGKSLAAQPDFKQRRAGFYGAGYIAPGYGIESTLPDIVCRRIMMDGVRPYIMAHRNSEACRMAIAMTIAELESQYSLGNQEWARENNASDSSPSPKGILALIFAIGLPVLLFVLSFSRGPVGIIAQSILFALLSSGRSSGGSRGFGGGGGGSFSGGGGSFGGGGGGGNF